MSNYLIDLDFDIADVEDSFKPLPEGSYVAKICKPVEVKKSKSGNQMIEVQWQITEGECANRKITDYIVIFTDPEKAFKLKQYAGLIGLESGKKLDPELFTGVEAILKISLTEQTEDEKDRARANGWDEGPKNNIKKVSPIG